MLIPPFVLLLIVALAAPNAAGEEGPPTFLRSRYDANVVSWVDETVAFDKAGRLRDDFWVSSAVRPNMKMNADGACTYFMLEPAQETFDSSATLAEIAASACSVMSGEVVSVSRGFFQGFPGTLIGFRVTNNVTSRADERASTTLRGTIRYTFIGKTELVTPDGAICSTTGLPVTVPQRGDTILITSYLPPSDEGGLIFPIHSQRHLVVERDRKRVFAPAPLRDELGSMTIDQAIDRVKGAIAAARRKQ